MIIIINEEGTVMINGEVTGKLIDLRWTAGSVEDHTQSLLTGRTVRVPSPEFELSLTVHRGYNHEQQQNTENSQRVHADALSGRRAISNGTGGRR